MKRTPLSLLILFLTAAATARAGNVIKAANTNNVELGTSWTSGTAPGSGDVAVYDNTITAGNTSNIGAAVNWQGLAVTKTTAGVLHINQANPSTNGITLGSAGVDMSLAGKGPAAANGDVTMRVFGPVTLSASQTWNIANSNAANSPTGGFNNNEDLAFGANNAPTAPVTQLPFNMGGFTVTKSGSGSAQILSGYDLSNGTININAGNLLIAGGSSKPTTVQGNVSLNIAAGATLWYQSNSGPATSAAATTLNGGNLLLVSNNSTNLVTLTGPLNAAANSTITAGNTAAGASTAITAANGGLMLSGNISGSGNINLVNNGSSSNLAILGGNNSGYTGTITLGASGSTSGRSSRIAAATAGSAAATWNIAANHTLQIHGVSANLGTLAGTGTVSASTGTGTLVTGPGSFGGTLANGAGILGITKTGSGTLTLTGANTYTGATAVNGGTLLLTPAQTGASAGTVADGASIGVNLATAGTAVSFSSLTTGVTSGATLIINTGNTGNPTVAPVNAGALNAAAPTAVQVTGASLSAGTMPLISYTSLSGLSNLTASLPPRTYGSLVDNPGASRIDLNITSVDKARWRGNLSTDWDADDGTGTGTLNWREITSGNATRYMQSAGGAEGVTFDDTADTGTVNLTTTLTPSGISVDNSSLNYSFTGSGQLSGAGGIEKSGTGTLVIANSAANSFTGTTTINAGTIAIGDGTTAGAGSLGTGAVVNNSTLLLNRPDDFAVTASSITGTGAIVKELANTANVTGAASAGNVAINSGTLRFDAGGTISGALTGTGNLRVAGGTLAIAGAAPNSFSGLTTVSAGTLQLNTAGGNAIAGNLLVTGTGGLTLSQSEQISDTATLTYDKAISGGTITLLNETIGAINILNGHDTNAQIIANTGLVVDGAVTIGGTGVFSVASNHSATIGGLALNGTTATLRIAANSNPSALNIGIAGITAAGGFIQVGQGTGAFDATLILEGGYTGTGNVLISDGAFLGTQKREIFLASATHTFAIDAGTTTTVEPDFAGGASLIKTGDGTLTLAPRSNSTYTGDTVISGGTLKVLGSLSGSNVIATGGTLAGTGLISTGALGADVNAGGKISPGDNGAGALTLNVAGAKLDLVEAVTPAASSTLVWNIDTPATSDSINLAGGALDIGSGVFGIDDIAFTAGAGLAPGVYTLIAGDTPISGTFAANITGPVGTMTGTLSKGDSDTDLILTVTNLTALQSWRQTHFGTTDNTGSAANNADPDGDGLDNIIEYLLDTIPTSAASAQTLTVADDGANFSLTYSRAKAALTDVDVFNEASTDLTTWSGTGVTETIISDDGTTQVVKLSVAKTLDRRQLRVRAAQK